jgi:hypothetical protein
LVNSDFDDFTDGDTIISSDAFKDISPLSKALSCKAQRHNPFSGSERLSLLADHGTIWLATSNGGKSMPHIQQEDS